MGEGGSLIMKMPRWLFVTVLTVSTLVAVGVGTWWSERPEQIASELAFDTATGSMLASKPIDSAVRCLVFSQDAKMLFAGCENGSIRFLDVTRRIQDGVLVGHAPVLSIAVSSD